MEGFEDAVIIEFPLRGEWMAPTTPEKKIPSHGIYSDGNGRKTTK